MILAIDLGSTSFKAAICDRRLRELGGGQHRLVYHYGPGGRVELGVRTVEEALRRSLVAAGVRTHDIQAIALTSQAQTFTLVDARGRAQGPFISWQDRRAGAACRKLGRELPDFGAHGSFGGLDPALQVCQLRALRPGHGLRPLSLPSYVLMLLSGSTATDTNLAAMTGLYSLPLGGWWPEALRCCGLSRARMSPVIPVGTVAAGTTAAARRFGLRAGIPVVLAGNDQTAGGYAADLQGRKAVLLTLGTAHVAYSVCRHMPEAGPDTIRGPYPGGLSYCMAADGCGGNIVNWAGTVLAGCHDVAGFFREATRAPRGCHGLVFDAALHAGQGGWSNLGLHHTSADMARSVLESLGRRITLLVDRVASAAGKRTVLVAGGGSTQPLWRKIVSEALGVSVLRTTATPLLGAARMASRA